jgi:hypothetical protein
VAITGSSFSYDPDNKSNCVFRFMAEHLFLFNNYDFPIEPQETWITYMIGDVNPTAVSVTPELTSVSTRENSKILIFSNTVYGFNEFEQ